MALQLGSSDDQKAGAEIYHGSEICKQKGLELLGQVGLPKGLILLDDLEECGYVRETGFVWLKRNKKIEHQFKTIGKQVQYGAEISGYVEQQKMKKVNGVKSKELLVWITISEISIDDPSSGNICFKSVLAVIKKSFCVGAFEIAEDENK